MNTYVIVPTYNEADNLDELLTDLLNLPVRIGVIVVDDGSPDGTGAMADKWVAAEPERVHVIHRAGKLGLGTAYLAGFKKAMDELGAEKVMTMDADFSHNPRYIPAMVEMSERKHIVIGSRYIDGGSAAEDWPITRRILSWGANFVTHQILGLNARDTTAGFRLYRREVLESIPLDKIRSSGYSFLVEMLYLCERQGWLVGEVPIVFEDRREGTTKISSREILKGQMTVLRLIFMRVRGTYRQEALRPVPEN